MYLPGRPAIQSEYIEKTKFRYNREKRANPNSRFLQKT
jgi:hypothetical protein